MKPLNIDDILQEKQERKDERIKFIGMVWIVILLVVSVWLSI